MKKISLTLAIILLSSLSLISKVPNFGADGLKGLSEAKKKALSKGKIIFSTKDKKGKTKKALIEAILIFNQTPEKTYKLLVRTQDQIKYLDELDSIKVIFKNPKQDKLEFKLSVLFITKIYRVIHKFEKEQLYIHWKLDKSFKKNGLKDLDGFWRFYPYGKGKTLARYGSNVSVKYVPSFIENLFKKKGVKKSLKAVKKFINSGGKYKR